MAGLLAAAQTLLGWYGQGNLIWFALGFYVLLSVVSFQYTLSAKHLENNRFVGRFLMTTGMRIILCAIFIRDSTCTIFIYILHEQFLYMILYVQFLYTILFYNFNIVVIIITHRSGSISFEHLFSKLTVIAVF